MMQKPASKIQRSTLAEQIEEHVRGLIVSNKMGAGEVLPSSIALAAAFGVSRSIVREAMKSLQAKGLIEIANGKRARVQPITGRVLLDFFDRFTQPEHGAVIEMLELRRGVEVQAALLAAHRRTDDDLHQMWELIGGMERKIGDPHGFTTIDIELHLAVAAASKNRMLFHLVESIRTAMRDTMNEGLRRHTDRTDWETIQASHVRLIFLIEQRDVEGAGACMARHFDEAIHGILTREPKELPPMSSSVDPAAMNDDD
jgi:GntR family transcriptional repressor for pyruvate dehydrogenase complex